MNSNQKRVAWALTSTLALCPLAACASNPPQQSTAQEQEQAPQARNESAESAQAQTPATAGWLTSTQAPSLVSDESRTVFESATQDWTGSTLNPIAEVATQVVAGTNHMYLCTSTPAESNAEPTWTMIVVYEDLNEDARITSVEELNLNDPATLNDQEDAPQNLAGGWSVAEPSSNPLTGDVEAAFAKAAESYVTVDLAPIALLGTQEGTGTGYLVLCAGTTTNGTGPQLYLAQVATTANNEAQMSSVELLNLLSYVDD